MMILYFSILNAVLCVFCCFFTNEFHAAFLVTIFGALQFVAGKQFRSACSLLAWYWYFIHQLLIPQFIPDLVGVVSVTITLIGLWVALGAERNRNDGEIRPGLVIGTIALYFLPFQSQHPRWVMAVMSTLFFLAYGLLGAIKDRKEVEAPITVFYFLLSTYWVLIVNTHWFFVLLRVAFLCLLFRAQVTEFLVQLREEATTTSPQLQQTKEGKVVVVGGGKKKKRANNNNKHEFTYQDGLYLGKKLMKEDAFITAMLDQRIRTENALHVKTDVKDDDPKVQEDRLRFDITHA